MAKSNHQRWQDGRGTGLADTMTDLIAMMIGSIGMIIIWLLV